MLVRLPARTAVCAVMALALVAPVGGLGRPATAHAEPAAQLVSEPAAQLAAEPAARRAAAGAAQGVGQAYGTSAKHDDGPQKLMLLFDSSGSMADPDEGGTTKIDAAKHAFATVLPKLPDDALVGLRVYGATVQRTGDPRACTDSQRVVPVGPLDANSMAAEIARFRPYGESPIAYSIRQAAKDLGRTGPRTILLVSDGEERCDPHPCETAKQISGLGIDLKIDVVGLKVSGKARSQLRCVADAGNGTFYEADDEEGLTASLERLSIRAFRPFKVAGTPVHGGATSASAPVLTAGQYVDSAPARGKTKHYKVRRTMPGSTIHLGVSTRPPPGSSVSVLDLQTTTSSGWTCGYGVGTGTSWARTNPLVTSTASSIDNTGTSDGKACSTARELDVGLTQQNTSMSPSAADLAGVPVEIVVVEEPAVPSAGALPGPATENTRWAPMPPDRPDAATTVIPGASFSDAPTVRPGAYRTSLFPGEVQFYRVRLDWGQRLQAEVRAPRPTPSLAAKTDYPQGLDIKVIGPTRGNARTPFGDVAGQDQTFLADDRAVSAKVQNVEVRYRNLQGCCLDQYASALPGDYYVAVSLGLDVEGQSYLVPMDVVIGTTGTPGAGTPAFAGGAKPLGPGVGSTSHRAPAALPEDPPATSHPQRKAAVEGDGALPLHGRLAAAAIAAAVCVLVLLAGLAIRRRLRARTRLGDTP